MPELRLPHITGTTQEQLAQMRTYLFQLVTELQYAISTLDANLKRIENMFNQGG